MKVVGERTRDDDITQTEHGEPGGSSEGGIFGEEELGRVKKGRVVSLQRSTEGDQDIEGEGKRKPTLMGASRPVATETICWGIQEGTRVRLEEGHGEEFGRTTSVPKTQKLEMSKMGEG